VKIWKCVSMIVFVFLLAGCQSATPTAEISPSPTAAPPTLTPLPQPTPTLTTQPTPAPDPVYVPLPCTLLGNPATTEVPAGAPIRVIWGWSAISKELVQEHIEANETVITLDGTPIKGALQEVKYDDQRKFFVAHWIAEVGVLPAGSHPLTYKVTWKRQISDGWDTYGPGSKNEVSTDQCEIMVK
jgi:hypothetical protein